MTTGRTRVAAMPRRLTVAGRAGAVLPRRARGVGLLPVAAGRMPLTTPAGFLGTLLSRRTVPAEDALLSRRTLAARTAAMTAGRVRRRSRAGWLVTRFDLLVAQRPPMPAWDRATPAPAVLRSGSLFALALGSGAVGSLRLLAAALTARLMLPATSGLRGTVLAAPSLRGRP